MTAYPQYLPILREEASQVIGECGWTKDALDRLSKLDSFIRETQRLSPLASGKVHSCPLLLCSDIQYSSVHSAVSPPGFHFLQWRSHPEGNNNPRSHYTCPPGPYSLRESRGVSTFPIFQRRPGRAKEGYGNNQFRVPPFWLWAKCLVCFASFYCTPRSFIDTDIIVYQYHNIAPVGGTRKQSSN